MNNYKLYYDSIFIGDVVKTDEESQNMYGDIRIERKNLPQNLIEYIDYSVKCSELMGEDEEKWIDYMEENEDKYFDLIESDKWYMTDENNNIKKILVPLIGKTDIAWMWFE